MVGWAVPAGASNLPREEKNTSAPAVFTSSGLPGAGSGAVRIVSITRSLARSMTETLRETKFVT